MATIDLKCPACEVAIGQVCFNPTMHVVLKTECPVCRRDLRLFLVKEGVYRSQYPADAPEEVAA